MCFEFSAWCPSAGERASGEQDVCLEKQLERFEWQLRILKEVLSANGNPERAELLKDHADEEVCALVLSILDKVRRSCRTDTTFNLHSFQFMFSRVMFLFVAC